VDKLIELSSGILKTALRMKDIVQPRPSYWHGVMTSPKEIYERLQVALEHYRQNMNWNVVLMRSFKPDTTSLIIWNVKKSATAAATAAY